MSALRELTWVELKLFAREPMTVMFVLVLPVVVLYVLNGVFGNQPDPLVWEGHSPVDYYTGAYVALVVATVGVLSLPTHLASYREAGVLRRFQASALPRWTLLAAHGLVATITGLVGSVLLTATSVLGYDATLPRSWPGVIAAFLLVTLAFGALGSLLGLVLRTARAAQGLGVLLFFVFMMLGGAGPPREVLPDAMATIGRAIPLTYASRALRAPWLGDPWDTAASIVLVGMLLVSMGLVAWRLRSE